MKVRSAEEKEAEMKARRLKAEARIAKLKAEQEAATSKKAKKHNEKRAQYAATKSRAQQQLELEQKMAQYRAEKKKLLIQEVAEKEAELLAAKKAKAKRDHNLHKVQSAIQDILKEKDRIEALFNKIDAGPELNKLQADRRVNEENTEELTLTLAEVLEEQTVEELQEKRSHRLAEDERKRKRNALNVDYNSLLSELGIKTLDTFVGTHAAAVVGELQDSSKENDSDAESGSSRATSPVPQVRSRRGSFAARKTPSPSLRARVATQQATLTRSYSSASASGSAPEDLKLEQALAVADKLDTTDTGRENDEHTYLISVSKRLPAQLAPVLLASPKRAIASIAGGTARRNKLDNIIKLSKRHVVLQQWLDDKLAQDAHEAKQRELAREQALHRLHWSLKLRLIGSLISKRQARIAERKKLEQEQGREFTVEELEAMRRQNMTKFIKNLIIQQKKDREEEAKKEEEERKQEEERKER